jgi:hypothetical protein
MVTIRTLNAGHECFSGKVTEGMAEETEGETSAFREAAALSEQTMNGKKN